MEKRNPSDLSVEFCGFPLKNPFILASAPPTATGAMIKRAFKAGWAGAVLKTTLMDPSGWINVTPRFGSLARREGKAGPREIYAFENIELGTMRSHEAWFRDIEDIRKTCPDRLIIASIMADASNPDEWQELARQYTSAGAHMIELNMSCPHGLTETGGMGSAIGQNAELSAEVTGWAKKATDVPIIPKMTANAADVAFVAKCCVEAGADAISAINTLAAIIGVDLERLVPIPNVAGYSAYGGLSGPAIKPVALRAVAGIAGTVDVPISGIGGITTWEHAAEFLLLGASAVQVCTAVMTHGYGIIEDLEDGLGRYMKGKGFGSVGEMVGAARKNLVPFSDLSTDYQVRARIDKTTCIGCDRCRICCRDSGSQAVIRKRDGSYEVKERLCIGCSLCQQVCPIDGCITMEEVPRAA
jgi:dihydropyrimidine dehydrogenase (NAD+) subunit PreA